MQKMIKLLLLILVCWKNVEGLTCYTCSNEPSFDACFKRGRLTQCQINEHACHTEVIRFMRPQGVVYSITKRCKQTDACENNFIQNPRAAWKPSQCNLRYPSSVCRCCCTKDKCNFGGFYCVVGPSCSRIPVIEQNGLTRCTLGRNANSICTNKCDADYELVGPKSFSCVDADDGSLMWNTTQRAGCIKTRCNEEALQISNGFATCTDGVNRGSICEFSCKENYVLQNGWPVTSCNSPDDISSVRWDSDIPTCARFTCPVLPSDRNARWMCSDSNRIGSSCGLRCDEGFYKVPAKGKAKCELNRNLLPPIWTRIPKCERITCPALSSPANGQIECSNGNFYGSSCKYSCSIGFLLTANNTPKCTVVGKRAPKDGLGTWDATSPTCRSAFCKPAIESISMGKVSCTDGSKYGSICSFSCAEGWKLTGVNTVVCDDTDAGILEWNRPIPFCKQITCREMFAPANGEVECSGNAFGDTCSFKCDELYYVNGPSSTTCGDSNGDGVGNWLAQPPSCRAIVCPSRPIISNGNVACTNGNMYKSSCTSTCTIGFKRSGRTTSTCERVGNVGRWSDPLARCLDIACPELLPLSHGSTSCTNSEAYGSRCSFKCDIGYEMKGLPSTTCQASEDWSNPLPVCTELMCNMLPPVSNGDVVCSRENRYDSICTYSCSVGYRMTGIPTLRCDGKDWSSALPVCEQITCSKVSAPLNGEIDCSGNAFGDTCSFKCGELYYVSGPSSIVCGDINNDGIGNWLSEPPTCNAIKCPSRPSVPNGIVVCTNSNMYKSTCTSSCLIGFKKSGLSVSTCERVGNKGEWSSDLPTCLDIACPELLPLSHGSTTCTNSEAYGSRCSFKCDIGYEMKGLPSTTCQASEDWSNPLPLCTEMKCSFTTPITSGTVTCSKENRYSSVCTYKCMLGYRLEGEDSLTCDGTKWSSPPPVCTRITCEPITSLLNGDVICTGNTFGEKCSFQCGELYYVSGSLSATCLDTDGDGEGDWSRSKPTCRPITCPQRSNLDNGEVTCTNGNMYKSVCTSSCSPGYKMSGPPRSTCEKLSNTGRWNQPLPQCLLKMCPVITAPDEGFMACTNASHIHSVCNFTCDDKHVIYPKGAESLTCLDDETWDKPLPCCFESCPPNAVMDMIILIDSSSSITRTNFAIVIDFVKSLVKSFQVANDMTKFGIFRYNRHVDTQNEIRLNSYKSMTELLNKIDKIPYNGEGTWTGQALQHALDFSLHPTNGNRRGAPDAILLITDGVTNIGDDLIGPAKGVHDRDIKLLAVFVPPFDKRKRELGIDQLVSLTGNPADVVLVEDGFASLRDIGAQVENFACEKECHRDDILHHSGEGGAIFNIGG